MWCLFVSRRRRRWWYRRHNKRRHVLMVVMVMLKRVALVGRWCIAMPEVGSRHFVVEDRAIAVSEDTPRRRRVHER